MIRQILAERQRENDENENKRDDEIQQLLDFYQFQINAGNFANHHLKQNKIKIKIKNQRKEILVRNLID